MSINDMSCLQSHIELITDQQLPKLREYECQEFDKCISVEYPDGENKEELLLRKKNGSELVFKGYLMNDVDASATLLINKDRTKYTVNSYFIFQGSEQYFPVSPKRKFLEF